MSSCSPRPIRRPVAPSCRCVSRGPGERLAALETHGIMADFREPDIIRVAPVPLYNSFHDAWRVATALALTA